MVKKKPLPRYLRIDQNSYKVTYQVMTDKGIQKKGIRYSNLENFVTKLLELYDDKNVSNIHFYGKSKGEVQKYGSLH